MRVNKNLKKNFESLTDTDADMELINSFTCKELTAEEVFSFSLILCDNEIDRDFERFDSEALEKLAKMFVGKSGLYNHSMDAKDQTARLYSCELVKEPGRLTGMGELYACLKGKAYLPRTAKNADLITEIKAGIKKEVSVGCAVGRVTCSVCGADLLRSSCGHKRGKIYEGKVCHRILSEPTDAYEWSFVAVPAQRAAGVTKNFIGAENLREEEGRMEEILKKLEEKGELTLNEAEKGRLREHLAALAEAEETAEAYRQDLLSEVIRLGKIGLPGMPGESLTKICKGLSIAELRDLKTGLMPEAEKVLPLRPQLISLSASEEREQTSDSYNHQFKI